jgi:hypothetical protein
MTISMGTKLGSISVLSRTLVLKPEGGGIPFRLPSGSYKGKTMATKVYKRCEACLQFYTTAEFVPHGNQKHLVCIYCTEKARRLNFTRLEPTRLISSKLMKQFHFDPGIQEITSRRCPGCDKWLPLDSYTATSRRHGFPIGNCSRCRAPHRHEKARAEAEGLGYCPRCNTAQEPAQLVCDGKRAGRCRSCIESIRRERSAAGILYPFTDYDDYLEIELSHKGQRVYTLIDSNKSHLVEGKTLNIIPLDGNLYVATAEYLGLVEGKAVYLKEYLHRLVLGLPSQLGRQDEARTPVISDHINENGAVTLDNRISNLRPASYSENAGNARATGGYSQFRGVSRATHNKSNPWGARIARKYLGNFPTEVEAALAADAEMVSRWGARALTNSKMFPDLGSNTTSYIRHRFEVGAPA